jgi:hypothetical protein
VILSKNKSQFNSIFLVPMSTTQDWKQPEALVRPYLLFRLIIGQIVGTGKKNPDCPF